MTIQISELNYFFVHFIIMFSFMIESRCQILYLIFEIWWPYFVLFGAHWYDLFCTFWCTYLCYSEWLPVKNKVISGDQVRIKHYMVKNTTDVMKHVFISKTMLTGVITRMLHKNFWCLWRKVFVITYIWTNMFAILWCNTSSKALW